MLNLFDCWVDTDLFDAKLDFAIRSWAQQSADLKATIEHTDQVRISAFRDMFSRFGFDGLQSDVRAHTVYYTQVGYISMMIDEPVSDRLKLMPAYVETYAGLYPTPSEIARFMARHCETHGN